MARTTRRDAVHMYDKLCSFSSLTSLAAFNVLSMPRRCSWQPENKSGFCNEFIGCGSEAGNCGYVLGVKLKRYIVHLLVEFGCVLSIFKSHERAVHRGC